MGETRVVRGLQSFYMHVIASVWNTLFDSVLPLLNSRKDVGPLKSFAVRARAKIYRLSVLVRFLQTYAETVRGLVTFRDASSLFYEHINLLSASLQRDSFAPMGPTIPSIATALQFLASHCLPPLAISGCASSSRFPRPPFPYTAPLGKAVASLIADPAFRSTFSPATRGATYKRLSATSTQTSANAVVKAGGGAASACPPASTRTIATREAVVSAALRARLRLARHGVAALLSATTAASPDAVAARGEAGGVSLAAIGLRVASVGGGIAVLVSEQFVPCSPNLSGATPSAGDTLPLFEVRVTLKSTKPPTKPFTATAPLPNFATAVGGTVKPPVDLAEKLKGEAIYVWEVVGVRLPWLVVAANNFLAPSWAAGGDDGALPFTRQNVVAYMGDGSSGNARAAAHVVLDGTPAAIQSAVERGCSPSSVVSVDDVGRVVGALNSYLVGVALESAARFGGVGMPLLPEGGGVGGRKGERDRVDAGRDSATTPAGAIAPSGGRATPTSAGRGAVRHDAWTVYRRVAGSPFSPAAAQLVLRAVNLTAPVGAIASVGSSTKVVAESPSSSSLSFADKCLSSSDAGALRLISTVMHALVGAVWTGTALSESRVVASAVSQVGVTTAHANAVGKAAARRKAEGSLAAAVRLVPRVEVSTALARTAVPAIDQASQSTLPEGTTASLDLHRVVLVRDFLNAFALPGKAAAPTLSTPPWSSIFPSVSIAQIDARSGSDGVLPFVDSQGRLCITKDFAGSDGDSRTIHAFVAAVEGIVGPSAVAVELYRTAAPFSIQHLRVTRPLFMIVRVAGDAALCDAVMRYPPVIVTATVPLPLQSGCGFDEGVGEVADSAAVAGLRVSVSADFRRLVQALCGGGAVLPERKLSVIESVTLLNSEGMVLELSDVTNISADTMPVAVAALAAAESIVAGVVDAAGKRLVESLEGGGDLVKPKGGSDGAPTWPHIAAALSFTRGGLSTAVYAAACALARRVGSAVGERVDN